VILCIILLLTHGKIVLHMILSYI